MRPAGIDNVYNNSIGGYQPDAPLRPASPAQLEALLALLGTYSYRPERETARVALMNAIEAIRNLVRAVDVELEANWIGGEGPTDDDIGAMAIRATSGKLPHVKRVRGTWNTYEKEL